MNYLANLATKFLGIPDHELGLRQYFFNVKDYGATGDGVTNDRTAIQNAYNAAKAAGGGIVFFPAGKYMCVVSVGIPVFQFSGASSGKILTLGEGPASNIVMAGDGGGGDKWLYDIKDGCKYKCFKDVRLHAELINEHEQQHLINYSNSSGSADLETGRAVIIDCDFGHTKGDAIRFLGNNTKRVRNILCKRCTFDMESTPGSHARSAFGWQRSADDITVDLCYATDDSTAIDFEPTGVGSNERMRIIRNHMLGQVTPSGNGEGFEHIRSTFAANCIVGLVAALDVQNWVLTSNIIDNLTVGAFGNGAMGYRERCSRMNITRNILYREGDTLTPSCLSVENHSVGENNHNNISNNIAINNNNTSSGFVLSFRDHQGTLVADNLLKLKINTANQGGIIRSEAPTESIYDHTFAGNLCIATNQATKWGFIGGGDDNVSVCGNVMRNINQAVGLSINGASTVAHNLALGATTAITILGTGTVTYCQIDGSGVLGPAIYLVNASPEGLVTAGVGSLALRSTGGGAGTTLYVKTSGTGNTGWTAK